MGAKKGVFAAVLLLCMPMLSLNAYSAALINEILANGIIEPDSEWVELFNNESFDVNLTGFNISETSSKNLTLNAIIPANGFIVLVENFTLFNSTFPRVNQSGIKIIEYGESVPDFELSNTGGTVALYNSSGKMVDSLEYKQSSSQENISVGRYPDGSSKTFNISTLTPGFKNDNQFPQLNRWIAPSGNSTNISGLVTITVNITDDTASINFTSVVFNGTNFSMSKNGDLWIFLWNTSLNINKIYNITVFFNDSYGKSGSDRLLNIFVNNSPKIIAFSPPGLAQAVAEGSSISFSINASDPDDSVLNFSWYIDGILSSTAPANFSYSPGLSDNGTHMINSTIRDSFSNQVSLRWSVSVANLNVAPVMQDIPNKSVSKGINLSFNISASDFDNDLVTYSANHSGFAISKINNSLATVSWKPSNADLGINILNFTVTDGSSADSRLAAISVDAAGNSAPNIVSLPRVTAVRNEPYSYDADASDSDNDTLRYSIASSAAGISIDSSTGLISFTPSSVGVFNVNVSVTDFVETANQSFNITAGTGSMLKIIDVDVEIDGRKSSSVANSTKIGRNAVPGSDAEFRIRLRNDFTGDEGLKIEGIGLKATIEEIDNDDDLEEEANEFGIRAGSEKSATLKFKIPLEADEGTFDVLIEAEGEDENGTVHRNHFEIGLELEKEKHDIRFLSFGLRPPVIICSRVLSLDYEVLNAGQEDEENAFISIGSAELGIDSAVQNISLNSGADGNKISKSAKLEIKGSAPSGDYTITAGIHFDSGRLSDSRTAKLSIGDCRAKKEAEQLLLPQNQESATTAEKTQIPQTEIAFSDDANIRLLALSTLAFTLFFVFTAIFLFTKI
ncbi:lamin tail domain-containing protein [Candidatus Woesearchaeota archaeon]|nr:lamin tail domain-containing protein [Candidatus Woesearchaeota archaeon]